MVGGSTASSNTKTIAMIGPCNWTIVDSGVKHYKPNYATVLLCIEIVLKKIINISFNMGTLSLSNPLQVKHTWK
jgi:sarcosine oxidase gamma subunit